jgi:hypothetical protein
LSSFSIGFLASNADALPKLVSYFFSGPSSVQTSDKLLSPFSIVLSDAFSFSFSFLGVGWGWIRTVRWGLTISQLFVVNALLPALMLLPLVPSLSEPLRASAPPSVREQCASLFDLVQRRAVWQPCAFIFLYNACQVTSVASLRPK